MFAVENQWCVVEMNDDDVTATVVYGPYPTKLEAIVFANEFNKEYDGSPYRAIMRPLMKMVVHAADTKTQT